MSEISIEPARRAHLATLVNLLADDALGQTRERIPEGGQPHPDYVSAFDAIEASPDHLLLVALADGRVVGCLQLSFLPGLSRRGMWRGQVEGVRVDRGARGQGIGERLLRAAIDRCRERGCGLVQLTSDHRRTDAARFYARLGFVPSHVGFKLDLPRSRD